MASRLRFPQLLFALPLLLAACQTVVDLDVTATPPQLVVEGVIERRPATPADTRQRLRLTTTVAFVGAAAEPPAVTDATVQVSDGTTTYDFTSVGGGFYECPALPAEVGRRYALRIRWRGEEYAAQTSLPDGPPIDSIYTAFKEETTVSPAGTYVRFDTRDPAGVRNYYEWRLFINGELQRNPDPGNAVEVIASDEFFDGRALTGLEPNGEITVSPGDSARVEQVAITVDQYHYLLGVFRLTGTGNPAFGDPPPVTPRGNVQNVRAGGPAAQGYFGAGTVAVAALVVPR